LSPLPFFILAASREKSTGSFRRRSMTLMRVKVLTYDPDARQAIAVLEDVAEQLGLAFLVPMNEANRLARALGLTPCSCVPVFELVENLLAHFEARVRRITLDGNEAGVSATLSIGHDGGEATFPCHPADALALAKRASAPIYATEEALRHACPLDQPHSHGTGYPGVKEWLERVQPADFGSDGKEWT
jgi:bifunctional DNase/RNase